MAFYLDFSKKNKKNLYSNRIQRHSTFLGVVIFFWSLNQVGPTSDLVTEYSLSSDFSNGPFDGRATIEAQLC